LQTLIKHRRARFGVCAFTGRATLPRELREMKEQQQLPGLLED
jgi:hypothetical protein